MTEVDIVDINAGSHQRYFATNFDPEINFREFTGTVYSWQQGKWQENKMFEIGKEYDLPVVGKRMAYLCGHDEVHSLAKNMDGADVRFWMGFGEHYINVFTVLKNIGLLSEQPVKTAEGLEVVPLKVVKACLPDPSSLAPEYTGKTCIGDFVRGTKDGKEHEVFIYNVADHKEAYEEVGSQGISYTAGVPPVAAAMLIATGEWDVKKMANVKNCRRIPSSASSTASACRPASRTQRRPRPGVLGPGLFQLINLRSPGYHRGCLRFSRQQTDCKVPSGLAHEQKAVLSQIILQPASQPASQPSLSAQPVV